MSKAIVAVALVVMSCSPPKPEVMASRGATRAPTPVASSGTTPSTDSPAPSTATSAPSTTTSALPRGTAAFAATPGRPYDAAALLLAMRPHRTGVPPDIENQTVAAGLADRIWTYDGRRYATLALQVFCDPTTCELSVTGVPHGVSPGERHIDDHVFAVRRGDLRFVDPVQLRSTLTGYPPALDARLDALARRLIAPGQLRGLTFEHGAWRVPPDTGVFELRYGTGEEEGSPVVYVTLDALRENVLRTRVGSA